MKTVFVGLSGGVDSSVSAVLLKKQGYRVVGVYMKNWSKDLPGFECPWKEDYQDAKRVAVQLGIEFRLFDFEKEYQQKVVDYMIEEYKLGRTPNPDIMCNQEIKFKLFLNTALEAGADFVATGHYAITKDGKLYAGKDKNKDQSYFLCRMTEDALRKTIFPLGDLTKPEVRELAKKFNLATANKKESMGICFVGKVGIKEFLEQFVETTPGPIIDQFGIEVGQHEGAIFYTIGQRHGLNVGGGLPYYVVDKDMQTNTVFVTTKIDDDRLWHNEISTTKTHWINHSPKEDTVYQVRARYRAPLVECKITNIKDGKCTIIPEHPIKAVTPGQSAVIYDGELVIGSGIVN
jgi:tRNA-specific 2-thiouridylase